MTLIIEQYAPFHKTKYGIKT